MLQLICIFTKAEELESTLSKIQDSYEVSQNRIFILSVENSDELVCSFNIIKGSSLKAKKLRNAMLVHRKKETNTLYTINSLNALIRMENAGIVDNTFTVNWNNYENSLLTTKNGELSILKTEVKEVYKF